MRAIERDNRPAVTYMVARLRVSRKQYHNQMLRRQRVIDENEAGLKKDPDFLKLPVPALAHKCIDIDMKCNWGGTALHIASVYGRILFVKQLLTSNATTGIMSEWPSLPGSIPLQIAAFLKYANIVEELVRFMMAAKAAKGAIKGASKAATTALKLLKDAKGEEEKPTIEDDEINSQLSNGATALLLSAQAKEWSTVELLLQAKGDPNLAEEEDLMRPVHVAVNMEQLDVVRKLTVAKANLNLPMRDGATALHIAAAQGNLQIVRFLVLKRIDLDKQMRDGRTAIKVAADRQKGNIVDELKIAGADDEQLTAFEGAKWSVMYAETHDNAKNQRRDQKLMQESTKRVRCGECAACLRNIVSLQKYGRPGKRRCLREKELIKLHTHHRVHFGPLEPFGVEGKIHGKYFLWLPNKVDSSAVEALDKPDEDPADRPSHDTDDDYKDPRHTTSQLIAAYHARRKVLVRDQKVLAKKLTQMRVFYAHTWEDTVEHNPDVFMHTYTCAPPFPHLHPRPHSQPKPTPTTHNPQPPTRTQVTRETKKQFHVSTFAGHRDGHSKDGAEYTDSTLLHETNQRMQASQWKKEFDLRVADLERRLQAAKDELAPLDLWMLRRAVLLCQRTFRRNKIFNKWYYLVDQLRGWRQRNASTMMSSWMRGVWARRYARKLKLVKRYNRLHNAAILIQKVFRGKRVAGLIPAIRHAWWLRQLGKKATLIQSRYLDYEFMKAQRAWFLRQMEKKRAAEKERIRRAALTIQKLIRGRIGRNKWRAVIGSRQLHTRLQPLVRQYLQDGDMYQLLTNLDAEYADIKKTFTDQQRDCSLFIDALAAWRRDHTRKLAEANRIKSFREVETDKMVLAMNSFVPNSGNHLLPGKKKKKKKHRKKRKRVRSPPKAAISLTGPVRVEADIEYRASLHPDDPANKRELIKGGGWAAPHALPTKVGPMELETLDEPFHRLVMYACIRTYPPRLEAGMAFDAALRKWLDSPLTLMKVREEQLAAEKVKPYVDMLYENGFRFIGDLLEADFEELGFPGPLIDNLHLALRMVRSCYATYLGLG